MPIGPAQSIKEFSILEKKEKRHDNISIIIIIIIIYASVPFFKVLLFDKCSVYSPLAYSFFFHQIKRFFFLFLTSIPISCCRCCHSWVNCFHVINFIDGKFVTLLVHSLLFFFFVDVCYNGYGICRLFFFFLHPVNDLHFRSKHIFRNAKESKKMGWFSLCLLEIFKRDLKQF